MKQLLIIFFVIILSSCNSVREDKTIANEICLNGDMWTFSPIKIPFYGYEMDAAERWIKPKQNHQFIQDAINDSTISWEAKQVRVPMSWSSAVSNPGETEVKGDFDFPYFWQYVHKGEYKRIFDIPESFNSSRIKLYFTSINFVCWIYVNGHLIKAEGDEQPYSHMNKLPFSIDITDYISAPSSNNELKIVVHDFSYAFTGEYPNEDNPITGISYPLGDRCDYYNKDRGWRNIDNGIIGDVILQSVPNITVEDIFVKTNVKKSLLEAEITVFNPTDKVVNFNISGYISEHTNNKKVLKIDDSKNISLQPQEKRIIVLSQTWKNPELWWPHSPHLYYFNTTISQGGKIIGRQRERFGFRQVEVIASENDSIRGFYLNGIRVRLFGESMEPTWKDGYSEGVSGAMYLYNPEYWSYTIDVCKELNINTLRTHRGMSLKRQFEIADEKGMMMIAESTINNGNHKGGYGTKENQKKAIRDMIKNYRNHPSIIFWSLANETPYNKEWEVEALLHDSTRPLTATQLSPTNYPSKNILTAACAYSMGLNGYSSEIYNRHDSNWTDKLLYVYEDNAHYDEPLDADRSTTVQKGLSIFRGHRTTGYEMIFTFYTWQKLFGQPKTEDKKLLKINWSEDQKQSCGYHPDYALMPLLDPWTDRENPKLITPLSEIQQSTIDFWKRTFSPVAVFDYEYDKRTNINSEIMPYVAKLEKQRLLIIHNDDLIDTTTAIEIRWKVLDFVKDSTISQGSFITNVLLGGVKQQKVSLKWANNNKVRVNYTCYKSGKERFSETIYLSDDIKQKKFTSAQEVKMTSDTLIIKATSYGVGNKGFESAKISNSFSSNVLLNDNPTTGDYVQFNPWITEDASYFLYLHIPQGFKGIQKVAIQHDTHNTEVSIDLSKSGWLKLIDEPLLMKSGELENNIKIHVTNDSQKVVADALKIIKYH